MKVNYKRNVLWLYPNLYCLTVFNVILSNLDTCHSNWNKASDLVNLTNDSLHQDQIIKLKIYVLWARRFFSHESVLNTQSLEVLLRLDTDVKVDSLSDRSNQHKNWAKLKLTFIKNVKSFYFEILKFSFNYLHFGSTTSINSVSECVSELACGAASVKAAQRGRGNVRSLKPSWQKSQSPTSLQARQRGPRAAMRDLAWGWLNSAAVKEEWQNARWWRPDSETVPRWFCEVKQTQWLKHITWLHCSEERERGSFTAQTERTSLFTCSDAWNQNVTHIIWN